MMDEQEEQLVSLASSKPPSTERKPQEKSYPHEVTAQLEKKAPSKKPHKQQESQF